MTHQTYTPRTDFCPKCNGNRIPFKEGDGTVIHYTCGSYGVPEARFYQSDLCDAHQELNASKAEVERLGGLLYETRSLLTEFFDCVDIGGLHDGDCNISTEDHEKWDLGCNCTTAELRKKYIQLYSK